MLRALGGGQQPPDALLETIYGETEGNAFFVEEVFKHLAEEGKLFDAQGRWRSDLQVSELDVPEGVRLVIGRRLERVSEQCRRVLTAAAVVGRAFSFELLEALGDADADALLDAVDEAERAHLIASAADGAAQTGAAYGPSGRMGEARFTFAHELIRQTLISGLSLPRRQRLHLRVAESMEHVYALTLDEHAADLAYHLYQAGSASDPEKTVRYLAAAGDQAMAQVAWEAAAAHYERALQAMDLIASPDERVRVDVLLALGLALGGRRS
jgi:predicted ATPase